MGFLSNLIVRIKGDNKDLSKKLKGSEKSVSGFSKSIKKLGGVIAGAFAIGALVRFGKELFNIARSSARS